MSSLCDVFLLSNARTRTGTGLLSLSGSRHCRWLWYMADVCNCRSSKCAHTHTHTHTHAHTHTHLCVCCLWVWAFAVLVTLCFFTLTSSSVFGIWTPGVSTMWVCAFPNGQAWLIKLMDGRNHWHSTYYTILLVCFLVQNLWRLQLRGSHVLVVGCPYSVFCK